MAGYYAETYCPHSPVILPQDIATAIGLTYSKNNYGSAFDGMLEYRYGKFHIYLNVKPDEHLYVPRVRFSFAHELAHYIIESHRRALMDSRVTPHTSIAAHDSDNEIEREAEFFASCLLLPASRVKFDVIRRKFNFTLVDEICSKYQTSVTATLLRFIALDVHPIMIVCSRDSKFAWMRYNEDFPFNRLRLGLNNAIPDCTSAGEYFYEGVKNLKKTEIVFAEDWFIVYRAEDRRRRFKEYCLYFEKLNQVISVIWEE